MKAPSRFLAIIALLVGLAAPGWATESSVEPRIVGGQPITPGEFPFMAAVVWSNQPDAHDGLRCGATMLSDRWFMTAAHCTDGWSAANFDVVVGRDDLTTNDGERIGVQEIVEHPGYDDDTFENDIALLRLSSPASVGAPIRWVIDNLADLFAPGVDATTMGWGSTENKPPGTPLFPEGMRKVEVPIRSTADCTGAYDGAFFPDLMLCAGFDAGGKDSCAGDSGGPIVVETAHGAAQVGIVSWGDGCAEPGLFGVYTRVATYVDWIVAQTGIDLCTGVIPTHVGTAGIDTIIGSPGNDVIKAMAGNDTIRAKAGDDLLCGGEGDDTIYTSKGDDMAFGEGGDDLLKGQGGSDLLRGGDLDDRLHGGPLGDELDGGDGDDKVLAHGGSDTVDGGNGDDQLRGGSGDDTMDGGWGSDQVYGVAGDDDLRGGAGDDDVRGQSGDDLARGQGGDDTIRGGTGTDRLYGGRGTDVCIGGELGLAGCEM